MVQKLHDMGIETMVSVWPQVDWRSENYEEMKQKGLLVRSHAGVDAQMIFHGNNVFMDATNPRTRQYVWEKCRQNYGELGVRAYWRLPKLATFIPESMPDYSMRDRKLTAEMISSA